MRGILHYLQDYKESDISLINSKYSLEGIDIILRGHYTAQLISLKDGSSTSLTSSQKSWTINEVDYEATRITGSIPNFNEDYIIRVSGGLSNVFVDGIFNKAFPFCNKLIFAKNTCSNEWYDWDSDQTPLKVEFNGDFDLTELGFTTVIRIEEGSEVNKTKAKANNTLKGYMPRGFSQILSGIATCDTINLGGQYVINTSVSYEDLGNGFGNFTFKFEEKVPHNDSCCEVLSIDEIATGDENGSSNCGTFAIDISQSGDTLTATANETATFKWYKGGALISTGSVATINDIGTYRVEAINDTLCKKSATINITSECLKIVINPFQTGNEINANIFNAPTGYTLSIKKGSTQVGTSLPLELTESGTYYIEVITPKCKKIAGFEFELKDEDCDFTLSISRTGDVLTANTNASSPTYSWELETMNGTSGIAGNQTTRLSNSGNYILKITSNGCEKSVKYLFIEDQECMKVTICNPNELISNPYKIVERLDNVSGNQFTLTRIDLTKVNNPNLQLKITLNGIDLGYENASNASEIDKYVIVGSMLKLFDSVIDSDIIATLN